VDDLSRTPPQSTDPLTDGRLRRLARAAPVALTHAEALHACRQEAERRGYRRALEAALAAERNATAAGKGATGGSTAMGSPVARS
jgi:hypothetical protein